jgi:hypothetical protein
MAHIQNSPERREFLQLAVRAVGSTVPSDTTRDYWVLERRLFPHAETCTRWLEQGWRTGQQVDSELILDSMHLLGDLYSNQGKLKEAEAMHQRALEGYEKALGPEHHKFQSVMQNMEYVRDARGLSICSIIVISSC